MSEKIVQVNFLIYIIIVLININKHHALFGSSSYRHQLVSCSLDYHNYTLPGNMEDAEIKKY